MFFQSALKTGCFCPIFNFRPHSAILSDWREEHDCQTNRIDDGCGMPQISPESKKSNEEDSFRPRTHNFFEKARCRS